MITFRFAGDDAVTRAIAFIDGKKCGRAWSYSCIYYTGAVCLVRVTLRPESEIVR